MDTNKLLNNLKELAKNEDFVFERLYRVLYNKDFYYKALSKLYSNKGAGTPGTDGKTVDGIREAEFDRIINSLRNESYQPAPVKRVYIPKKNNKKRPLGLPSFTDKLVQEIIRVILDAIYEPIFSQNSHGFRNGKSCHTALNSIQWNFRSVSWFIEGDVVGCFDNINHDILIRILRKRIKDERFLNLIRKFLKSGYLEDWQYHNTYSGCPQGSIIGPILSNIYLNELDKFVEEILIPEFNRGTSKDRKRNPDYRAIEHQRRKLKESIHNETDDNKRNALIKEYKKLGITQRGIPQRLPNQGEYKKLSYVRYADDWIIGVIGSKGDCQDVKNKIETFLREELKLELSQEKTLITHSSKTARFLGYDITVRRDQSTKKIKDGRLQRKWNRGIDLKIPPEKLKEFIIEKGLVKDINASEWRMKHRPQFLYRSDLEILKIYDAELRGLYNYYSMASNVSHVMNQLHYVMEYSCLKTLANKHKTSLKKYRDKHRIGKDWGIKYRTKKGEKTAQLIKSFPRNKGSKSPNVDNIPNTNIYALGRTELETRLRACKCELCGAENVPVEVHHVNKLKNLKGKTLWEKTMISMKRKTLVLCRTCHNKLHAGTL